MCAIPSHGSSRQAQGELKLAVLQALTQHYGRITCMSVASDNTLVTVRRPVNFFLMFITTLFT